ncbi:MAG: metal-dependent hydrolase [Candidatus Kerfeldbacteria bacterium]|nr:metal-dependent hydrolase [Candidatus Kerfeldbacteria bacterium]
MFISAHILSGLAIGEMANSLPAALVGALFPDLDHLVPYFRFGVFRSWGMFWRTVRSHDDPYGCQRNYFHSIWLFGLVTAVCIALGGVASLAFVLGYGSHLVLDALDSAEWWPFYPLRTVTVRGPIGYLSRGELLVTIFLAAVVALLWLRG